MKKIIFNLIFIIIITALLTSCCSVKEFKTGEKPRLFEVHLEDGKVAMVCADYSNGLINDETGITVARFMHNGVQIASFTGKIWFTSIEVDSCEGLP